MVTHIENIIYKTIDIEGGYSDRKADRGGPTKYGITQKTWAAYTNRLIREVTKDEIKNLTKPQAFQCYKDLYLKPNRVEDLPFPLQHVVFDMAVNHGPSKAGKLLQLGLSHFLIRGLSIDGVVGDKTIKSAFSLVKFHGAKKVVNSICDARQRFYQAIVDNDVTRLQKENLNGWTNRNNWFRENIKFDETSN